MYNSKAGRSLISALTFSSHHCPTCGASRSALTQGDLGIEIGVSPSFVSRHRHGSSDLGRWDYQRALQALAIPEVDFRRLVRAWDRRIPPQPERLGATSEGDDLASELVRSWARRVWNDRPRRHGAS